MDRTCDPCRVNASDASCMGALSLGRARHRSAPAGLVSHRNYTARRMGLDARPVLYENTLVNVRRHRDNPFEPIRSCVFSPSMDKVSPHRERSSEWALCVLGRCFSGGGAANALLTLRAIGRSAPDAPTKAPSPSGRALTQQTGECRRRTHQSDAAHDPSGAALCRDRSEQASKPTMRLAHERAPGSTNAPLYARSRPTVLFLRWMLAGTPCMSGVSGSRFAWTELQ